MRCTVENLDRDHGHCLCRLLIAPKYLTTGWAVATEEVAWKGFRPVKIGFVRRIKMVNTSAVRQIVQQSSILLRRACSLLLLEHNVSKRLMMRLPLDESRKRDARKGATAAWVGVVGDNEPVLADVLQELRLDRSLCWPMRIRCELRTQRALCAAHCTRHGRAGH